MDCLVVDYSTLPLPTLHILVRKNLSLLKDERIKDRLPELATYIPEFDLGPLIFHASIMAAIYYDDVHMDYLRILLENGADPNATSYKIRKFRHESSLDNFFRGIRWTGEIKEKHKEGLMLLIQYGLKVDRIREKWYYRGEIFSEMIHFCKEYAEEWKKEEEELCCKQVDQ